MKPKLKPGIWHWLLVLPLLFIASFLQAQQAIFFTNPSFEDYPAYSKTPGGWQNCAFNHESPPDVHPVPGGSFGVVQQPAHGKSYLGLVARENAAVESVGQPLQVPMRAGMCYAFSIRLCKSENLLSLRSPSPIQSVLVNYNLPLVLRIFGGISPCGQKVLLAQSPAVAHLDWKKYVFQIEATDSLTHLTFEAGYVSEADTAYAGNILLDHLSPLIPIDCQSFMPLVDTSQLVDPGYDFQISMRQDLMPFRGHRFDLPKKPKLESLDELKTWMAGQCATLHFWEGQFYVDELQRWVWREIASNLRRYPDQRLWVVLADMPEKEGARRAKAIRQVLSHTKLPEEQFLVVFDRKTQGREGWLCQSGGLWIKLEKF